PFELMASNLKVSVDYFKRETKEPTVNKVVVCGDGKLLEFEMFLKQGLADSMGADISVFTMDNMKEHIENINELAARQQVAVGLAMLAFDPKDAAINILPHGGASTAAITADLSAYKPLAIEAAALAACLLALNFYMNSNAAALIKGAGTAVGGRFEVHSVPMSSDIGQINSAIAALNKKKAFMDLTVGNGRFYLTKKLGQLGNVLPVEAWIEKLEYINPIDSAPEILIDGMLFSEEKNEPVLASALLNRAKSNPVFSEHLERIEMGSLLRKNAYDKDLLTFKLTCRGDQGPYEALGKDFSMSRRR
ncbi:MAG: hypothetical protein ABH825_03145, partial [Candidatus Omnitrophota bacterium]